MKNADLNIESKKISELNPAPYNPRYMTDKQRKGLDASMDEFGLVEPIVWNKRTGYIVGGHQRLDKLVRDKVEVTDVVVVDLDDKKEKALNIALNHHGIAGEFEVDKLTDLLTEIENEDYFDDLNFGELHIPSFEELPDVEQPDENKQGRKVVVKIHEAMLYDEVKDLISRTIADHYTPNQVTVP